MDKNRIIAADEATMKLNHDARKKEWEIAIAPKCRGNETASQAKGRGLDI